MKTSNSHQPTISTYCRPLNYSKLYKYTCTRPSIEQDSICIQYSRQFSPVFHPPHLSLRQHNISGLIHLFHPPISRRVVAVSGSSIKYFARILYIVHVRYCRIERMRSLRWLYIVFAWDQRRRSANKTYLLVVARQKLRRNNFIDNIFKFFVKFPTSFLFFFRVGTGTFIILSFFYCWEGILLKK